MWASRQVTGDPVKTLSRTHTAQRKKERSTNTVAGVAVSPPRHRVLLTYQGVQTGRLYALGRNDVLGLLSTFRPVKRIWRDAIRGGVRVEADSLFTQAGLERHTQQNGNGGRSQRRAWPVILQDYVTPYLPDTEHSAAVTGRPSTSDMRRAALFRGRTLFIM
ncbi:hypothetical protein VTN00DRAFT_744 [Thermoascus crustaceus]|uniref:uncharacterized protein n=1 Tax=Thermoascus crustaceus TaxID=5088 RepID=UPI003741EFAD